MHTSLRGSDIAKSSGRPMGAWFGDCEAQAGGDNASRSSKVSSSGGAVV